MENRYKIPTYLQKIYLEQTEQTSGLHGEQLAALLGIVGRSYRDWRRGKFALTEHAVKTIEKHFNIPFPYSKEKALLEWKQTKTIAAKKGGLARVQKYGFLGTPEGRSKGGKRGIQVLRERGLIPIPKPFLSPTDYSKELAEFVGILLGDGHIGKGQWSISLNATADKEYVLFVFDMIEQLFRFHPALYFRPDCNTAVIVGSGKRSIEYFTHIGLTIGNKVKQQVGVPNWITQNSSYSLACLRGLVDTDGGIFNHRYKVNGKLYMYKKFCFANRSIPLLSFVSDTLKTIDLTPKTIDKVENKRVWLYNQNEVKKYIERVGTHNPRLLTNMGG